MLILLVLVASCKDAASSYTKEEKRVISDMEQNCENIGPDNAKCYVDLAISTKNPDYCKKINDKESRENCKKILSAVQGS